MLLLILVSFFAVFRCPVCYFCANMQQLVHISLSVPRKIFSIMVIKISRMLLKPNQEKYLEVFYAIVIVPEKVSYLVIFKKCLFTNLFRWTLGYLSRTRLVCIRGVPVKL